MPGRARSVAVGGAVVATAAVALAPIPGLSAAGRYALATATFAAVLWVTEGLPLPVTALCVPVLLALFGVVPSMEAAVAGFADPIVFLLLAGFVLAEALQAHDVDRRIAYWLVNRVGSTPERLVLAVMIATAGLSMVVSNSATTAMMVPVALGIARQVHAEATPVGTGNLPDAGAEAGAAPSEASTVGSDDAAPGADREQSNLEVALLLGTAYAASIGGVGTLIGTPPNAIVVAVLDAELGVGIGFVEWLVVGLPLVAVGLPLAWYLLAYRLYPPTVDTVAGARAHAGSALAELGPLSPGGRRVVVVTGATAGLWVLGGFDFLFEGVLPPQWYATLFGGPESLLGGPHQGALYYVLVGLAAIPVLVGSGAVDWEDVADVDWGTLLLLGGGIALANGLSATDATRWLADATFGALVGAPVAVVALAVVSVTVLLSELASNTALAAVFSPLLVSLGPRYAASLGTTAETASVFLAVLGAVAASFGFALPVATPPNAIAFGTGEIEREDMLRAGVALDVVMILVATGGLLALFVLVWPRLF